MKKLFAFLILLVCAAAPLAAQEVFVSNRPFKGAVERAGAVTLVELEPFAASLGLDVHENEGSLFLFRSGQEAGTCPSGAAGPSGVFFGEKRLETARLEGTSRMIGLEELSQALNARVVKNPQLGTIDVYRPAADPCEEAGYRLVGFGSAEDLPSLEARLGGFAPAPLALVDIDDRKSQGFQTYGQYFQLGATPYTILMDPSGRVVREWKGTVPGGAELEKAYRSDQDQKKQANKKKIAVRKKTKPGFAGKGASSGGGGG
ncbi:MAG: hypothetical protein HY319_06010 [Armatimonadetes bacterium]|nr:hypothetical protein [Armatimonadota bacterium]